MVSVTLWSPDSAVPPPFVSAKVVGNGVGAGVVALLLPVVILFAVVMLFPGVVLLPAVELFTDVELFAEVLLVPLLI